MELNTLDLWATDVRNAYLEALTEEKIYIVAGPQFRESEGHILIIQKASYAYAHLAYDGTRSLLIVCAA